MTRHIARISERRLITLNNVCPPVSLYRFVTAKQRYINMKHWIDRYNLRGKLLGGSATKPDKLVGKTTNGRFWMNIA